MVFKRREKQDVLTRIRESVYPRRGWRRAIEYLSHRVRRLPDTPANIALGFSCGVFASFTPFFGTHFLIAGVLAWLLRGNIVAALIGTGVGNPLTFPAIAWISMALGRRILGYGATGRDFDRVADAFLGALGGLWHNFLSLFGHGEAEWQRLAQFLTDVVLPYFVGGILPGLVASILSYYLLRPIVAAYQSRRRLRLLARTRRGRRESKADAADQAQYSPDGGADDDGQANGTTRKTAPGRQH